ncbi:unnamed protein product [Caenorhabditis bovis]|uniref:PH domain-containing protein n=1 Tax=Caenorhabditis bovis TaxID=2654633 RepID=A0A8S1EBK6_9PELO|nr:unnamed protein product [Caenorhabditis bovis]
MFCNCDNAIDIDMDIRKLKEGDILKYKSGFLGSKWKKMHAVLFSDSRFCWFEEKGDRKPKGSILLKDVVPYICVGLMTDRMPVKRPQVPDGSSVHHLVGIGMDPKAETVHWILFSSDSDIESWFNEITKTLPKPNPPPGGQNPGAPAPGGAPPVQPVQSGGYVPPPKYPDAPPPVQPVAAGGGGYPPHSGGYPQQPGSGGYRPPPQPAGYGGYQGGGGYPQGGYGGGSGPSHTTVIVRDGGYGGGGSGFGGTGMGFGTGMLAGSLLGYGLGSMWGGHHSYFPSYGMGGFGGGYGMGGGYYSDNDTNITNNYYNYGDGGNADHNSTGNAGEIEHDHQPDRNDGLSSFIILY